MGKGKRNKKEKQEVKDQAAPETKEDRTDRKGLEPDLTGNHKRPSRRASRNAVPSVIKSKMLMMDRIYAEHGMVVGITKDGDKNVMGPAEALHKAREINSIPVGSSWQSHKDELVRKIIEAYRQAGRQLEDKSNPQYDGAHMLRNMAMGRAPDGGDILDYGKEDSHVQYYAELCPHLQDWEIAAVLRQIGDAQAAHQVLLAENFDRAWRAGDMSGKLG